MADRKPKPAIRPTRATRRVILVLLSGASNLGGYTICRAAGRASGTIHPILARLEAEGWAESEWRPGPAPRRRVYRLTPRGRYYGLQMLGLEERDDA